MLTHADVLRSSAGALLPFVSVRDDDVFCEVLGEASCRYSIYLLYWYKSTNTDAECCF